MPGFAEELLSRFRWIAGHADVLGLLADADFLAHAVAALAEPFENEGVTKVAAVEARGFVFGSAVALRLGAGFVPVRKPGSNVAAASSPVSARRLLPSESRSRPKKPSRCSAVSSGPSASPSSSDQLLAIGAER